ncbi:glutamine--fructose-6-phosphate transaminase (isomerizing) [Roseovarius indicus]|uniref:glutamine--fructose-6-phosphate transaminase (isomerizing) n=1 Tax=Roseovarius indicus TaxID=540747 RepID=UPI0035169360
MCGIIGIIGKSDVSARLMAGLSRLEYRGYDSAGVAVMDVGRITIKRAVGKLDALRDELGADPVWGNMGLGHTRWATHGPANQVNAHPHQAGSVTLVHNGIIENYLELKAELTERGVNFLSQTDTAVVAHYLNHLLGHFDTLDDAFRALLDKIVGSYALAVMFEGYPDLMFAARNGPPLAIGYGRYDLDGRAEMFVGSDALSMHELTDRVSYLEDGDWAIIRPEYVEVRDRSGAVVEREIVTTKVGNMTVDKGPFPHFMLKEIHDQPDSLGRLLSTLFDSQSGSIKLLENFNFNDFERVVLVACGTAHYACHVAKYWFEAHAGLQAEIELASEYRYRKRAPGKKDCLIVVSQSGETADTLAALKDARGKVAARIALVNVPTSSIAREADAFLDVEAGNEVGVASTKAFTAQLLALLALSLKAGRDRGEVDEDFLVARTREMISLPTLVMDVLALEGEIAFQAEQFSKAQHAIVLGRGVLYPIALEIALKIKEISYIHAEGYAAGELKHGPIALVDENIPVLVLDSNDDMKEKTASNAAEVEARGAKVFHIGPEAAQGIRTPAVPLLLNPFVPAVVGQLWAYYAAIALGRSVDQPRNLAKSVTVE